LAAITAVVCTHALLDAAGVLLEAGAEASEEAGRLSHTWPSSSPSAAAGRPMVTHACWAWVWV
jgi:hypothetical protein